MNEFVIEKFRVYTNKFCTDDESCGGVVSDANGEFFKVKDVEVILNNTQYLKSKIVALSKQLEAAKSNGLNSQQVLLLIQDLQQLSTVA